MKNKVIIKIAREAVKIILLLAAGFLILRFAAFYGGMAYGDEMLSTYNSNAKLAFTNTATYLTKLEESGGKPSDMDGVYYGSLQREKGIDYGIPFSAEGTSENFDYALKWLMGSENAEWAGYYFVIIKDGIPLQSCWSKSDELFYRGERLARRAAAHSLGENDLYNGGERIGNYPDPMTGIVKTPPEWFEETWSDRLRAAKGI